jgi:hypothetical protein
VTTQNPKEVQRERDKILDFVVVDAHDTLQRLMAIGSTAKPARYDHRIQVSRGSGYELQTWRVVNGLYLDEASGRPGEGFDRTRRVIERVMAGLAAEDWRA